MSNSRPSASVTVSRVADGSHSVRPNVIADSAAAAALRCGWAHSGRAHAIQNHRALDCCSICV